MSTSTPVPLSAFRLDRCRRLIDGTVSVTYRDGLSRLTLGQGRSHYVDPPNWK
jgi:hypothetical protein